MSSLLERKIFEIIVDNVGIDLGAQESTNEIIKLLDIIIESQFVKSDNTLKISKGDVLVLSTEKCLNENAYERLKKMLSEYFDLKNILLLEDGVKIEKLIKKNKLGDS